MPPGVVPQTVLKIPEPLFLDRGRNIGTWTQAVMNKGRCTWDTFFSLGMPPRTRKFELHNLHYLLLKCILFCECSNIILGSRVKADKRLPEVFLGVYAADPKFLFLVIASADHHLDHHPSSSGWNWGLQRFNLQQKKTCSSENGFMLPLTPSLPGLELKS